MPLDKTSFDRRSFLKVSAAGSGGLILSFSWLAPLGLSAEPIMEATYDWLGVQGYLKIDEDGIVTIMSQNPEIGQGVKTSMPMIVSEELDADWNKVVVEQAPLDTESFNRQSAGGSQSIRAEWDNLRKAGATARHLLLVAAATAWGVDISELTTSEGVITHAGTNRSGHYGEFASAAALVEVPEEVELKDPKDFKLIGTRVGNVDAMKIVTGKPLFGFDIERDDMLIAMCEHPPAFGMKIKSFDDSRARTMPGIVDIFKVDINEGWTNDNWSVKATKKPEMIAVVGRTSWEVMQAKKALNVEWETEFPAENTSDHNQAMDELLSKAPEKRSRVDGNPDDEFAVASDIIERKYSAPFLAHNTMEPMNFYANVTANKAELVGPVQTPGSLREAITGALGIPKENVSVEMTRMGGGFGRRLYGDFGLEAAKISLAAGAPVKLIYTREDDMTYGNYRPSYKTLYRAAFNDQNELTALHIRGTGIGSGGAVYPDRFPSGSVDNFLVEREGKDSNISTAAWRAPSSNFAAFAEQSFLDEIAEKTGEDPVEMRLRLLERAMKDPVGEELRYDPERYAGVLKLVRDKSGWDKPTPGIYRGVAAYFCHNTYVAQVVDVSMAGNKMTIEKVWCAVDCGIVVNLEGALQQVEGSIVDGIGHAMYSELTIKDGKSEQKNFDRYRLMRNSEAPNEIEVHFVDNGISPTGLGEPALPPVMAALANAIYKATGKRVYSMPFVADEAMVG